MYLLSTPWGPFCLYFNLPIHKHMETHGCIVSAVATDAVPKHQAINILSAS